MTDFEVTVILIYRIIANHVEIPVHKLTDMKNRSMQKTRKPMTQQNVPLRLSDQSQLRLPFQYLIILSSNLHRYLNISDTYVANDQHGLLHLQL